MGLSSNIIAIVGSMMIGGMALILAGTITNMLSDLRDWRR